MLLSVVLFSVPMLLPSELSSDSAVLSEVSLSALLSVLPVSVLLSVFSSTASVLSVLSELPVSSPPNRSLKNPTILSQRPSSFA